MLKGNDALDNVTLRPYLQEISRMGALSSAEEARLAARIRKGDAQAVCTLVRANLRFVVNVARAYQHQGLPLADLINEGNIGMMRAAQRFDERKNFRFITYAVWWVRQSILKALAENSRVVKLPLNRVGTLYRITKAQARMEQKLARKPNEDEVAAELHMRPADVAGTLRAGSGALSLDAPVQDDEASCLGDLLQVDDEELPDAVVRRHRTRERLHASLCTLDERERQVVSMYFGLNGEEPYSLEEIGRHLGLTRERARQLKQQALTTLRHCSAEIPCRAVA